MPPAKRLNEAKNQVNRMSSSMYDLAYTNTSVPTTPTTKYIMIDNPSTIHPHSTARSPSWAMFTEPS